MDIPEMQQLIMKHKDIILGKSSEKVVAEKEDGTEMTQGIDLQSLSTGGGFGGVGGGLLGGVLLGALLGNRNGLFGGTGDVSGLNNLQGAIDTNAILSNLGDIKAAVPLAEAQVQLALAGAQADITSQTLQQTIGLTGIVNDAKSDILAANAASNLQNANSFSFLKSAVDGVATQIAIGVGEINSNVDKTGWALSREISCDGEKTRALINSIDRENLNRLITTQANEIVELRNERNRDQDRHGIEITMTNIQNQAQLQAQAQNQTLNAIAGALVEVGQIARATNSNVIVGNTGATGVGAQNANPTNVRA
jgi:hypothetical protein